MTTEERFEQDFMWYEWSFVSPEDVPRDDLQVPAPGEPQSITFPPGPEQWREDRGWTT